MIDFQFLSAVAFSYDLEVEVTGNGGNGQTTSIKGSNSWWTNIFNIFQSGNNICNRLGANYTFLVMYFSMLRKQL